MNDRDFFSPEHLDLYCNTNERLLKGDPKALVLEFPGLGGGSCLGGTMDRVPYENGYTKKLAENGILICYMFPGPWNWMTPAAVRMTDLTVDAIKEKFGLTDSSPMTVTGGSMGGQSALIYSIEGRNRATACAVACPQIDPYGRFFDYTDSSRAYISAVCSFDCPIEEGFRKITPMLRADELPDIPYLISADGNDVCVSLDKIEAFSKKLTELGRNVELRVQPGLAHGAFFPEERAYITDFIIRRSV